MEPRQIRGLEIAEKCEIKRIGFQYRVPSQAGQGYYYVSLEGDSPKCTCPDHETRGVTCKHAYAVQYSIERKENDDGSETVTETVQLTETRKRTYRQDWPAYNAAQTSEKHRFQELMHDLCRGIDQTERGKGRPRIPLPVAVFSCAFKVYSTVSGRRFMCDLKDAHERGYIAKLPHYNSIFNAMEDPEMTPLLHQMIQVSSLPLKTVEVDFAADSSGFSTSRFTRWYDQKYGGGAGKSRLGQSSHHVRSENEYRYRCRDCRVICERLPDVPTAYEKDSRELYDERSVCGYGISQSPKRE